MTGAMRLICSPSRSTISRSTPCVEGCCGPKLTVSSSPPNAPCSPVLLIVTPGDSIMLRPGPSATSGALPELHYLAAHRIVAAQRVAHPVVRHQDSRQARVVREDDAEHVVRLPFLPG